MDSPQAGASNEGLEMASSAPELTDGEWRQTWLVAAALPMARRAKEMGKQEGENQDLTQL